MNVYYVFKPGVSSVPLVPVVREMSPYIGHQCTTPLKLVIKCPFTLVSREGTSQNDGHNPLKTCVQMLLLHWSGQKAPTE